MALKASKFMQQHALAVAPFGSLVFTMVTVGIPLFLDRGHWRVALLPDANTGTSRRQAGGAVLWLWGTRRIPALTLPCKASQSWRADVSRGGGGGVTKTPPGGSRDPRTVTETPGR